MCSNNFITNPFGITAKAADPLNLSQGHGFDLANPVGGWKYKVSPLNDRITPKAPEVAQPQPQAPQTAITYRDTSRVTNLSGLQIPTQG
jgi:hypothetical protein